jgi:hypothetical protein
MITGFFAWEDHYSGDLPASVVFLQQLYGKKQMYV